jgi:hypothetical protein
MILLILIPIGFAVMLAMIYYITSIRMEAGTIPRVDLNQLSDHLRTEFRARSWSHDVDLNKGYAKASENFNAARVILTQQPDGSMKVSYTTYLAAWGWGALVAATFGFFPFAIVLLIAFHFENKKFAKSKVVPIVMTAPQDMNKPQQQLMTPPPPPGYPPQYHQPYQQQYAPQYQQQYPPQQYQQQYPPQQQYQGPRY